MSLLVDLGIGLVVLVIVLSLAFTFVLAWRLVHPLRKPFISHPRDFAIPYEEAVIPSPFGKLAAWFLPGTNGRTLIALHGINDNKEQWLAQAVDLQQRGYASLLLDFRGHGASEGRHVTFGERETEDVAAALDYLRQRGDVDMQRVGLIGLSLGGIAAIMAAARLPAVRAIMAESAFPDLMQDLGLAFRRFTGVPSFPFAQLTAFWGQIITGISLSNLRPIELVGSIAPRPVFIIGDLKDNLVSEPMGSQGLYDRAGEPKRLWQLPEAGHVCAYKVRPQEYIDQLDTFFTAAL